jgi:hypothetical protein
MLKIKDSIADITLQQARRALPVCLHNCAC